VIAERCRNTIASTVTDFQEAFEAGRNAVRNRRTAMLFSILAFMAGDTIIYECLHHHYVLAALSPVFFLIVMPWLGWKWIRPER
jgi:hypothetical protein